ncbi:MotA/TolQ/ExbB proton channel family protein [Tepidanaerobacter syntrophicus]|uniref:MotA/TolQ/ExbB proton channel family protein n=1 Tax=Tepidanaerobacter syntrophicus TaxID=224999 RepID=UPI001BD5AF40|nr:MotA/TolQ/ExbB proton channel family protein [Tepidanaerobacter syntrophicus]
MNSLLSNALHMVGQALLIPCLVVLMAFMAISVWEFGGIIVEYFMEHRKLKADIPTLIKNIATSSREDIGKLIDESALLYRQKKALHALLEAENMSKTSLTALAQRLLANEEDYYERATILTDLTVKLGPVFGLLGTLIPLGPGIVALGQGDTATLSASLGVAFDTTIAGLISAAVCYVISGIRKRWYNDYIITIETIMINILEEVAQDDKKFRHQE